MASKMMTTLGYGAKEAFKTMRAKPKTKSYNEATYGSGAKGKAGYYQMTQDERQRYKVEKGGIAPTAIDPSKQGAEERAEAASAKARGELSNKEIEAQEIVKGRGIDEAHYNASIQAAKTANAKAKELERQKKDASKGVYSTDTTSQIKPQKSTPAQLAKKMSDFGFAGILNTPKNTGEEPFRFGNLASTAFSGITNDRKRS